MRRVAFPQLGRNEQTSRRADEHKLALQAGRVLPLADCVLALLDFPRWLHTLRSTAVRTNRDAFLAFLPTVHLSPTSMLQLNL